MSLLDVFPKDPFQRNLGYATKTQLPITVPWANEIIKLGVAFSVSTISDVSELTEKKTPFSDVSLNRSTLVFTNGSQGSLNITTGSTSSSSSQHVTSSVSVQIGTNFAKLSGRANYEKHVNQDSNNNKSSLRFGFRGGVVAFAEPPQLSVHAKSLLSTSAEPHTTFREQFGEYYVGAYFLGGSNASMLSYSTASATASEDLSARIEAEFLTVSVTKNIEQHERSSQFQGAISISSFDSLDVLQDNRAGDGGGFAQILQTAGENKLRGSMLSQRVTERSQQMGIIHGSELSWDKCDAICEAGLVVEILLLPFTGLRSYVAAVLSP